jgi:hypothetical protein
LLLACSACSQALQAFPCKLLLELVAAFAAEQVIGGYGGAAGGAARRSLSLAGFLGGLCFGAGAGRFTLGSLLPGQLLGFGLLTCFFGLLTCFFAAFCCGALCGLGFGPLACGQFLSFGSRTFACSLLGGLGFSLQTGCFGLGTQACASASLRWRAAASSAL